MLLACVRDKTMVMLMAMHLAAAWLRTHLIDGQGDVWDSIRPAASLGVDFPFAAAYLDAFRLLCGPRTAIHWSRPLQLDSGFVGSLFKVKGPLASLAACCDVPTTEMRTAQLWSARPAATIL